MKLNKAIFFLFLILSTHAYPQSNIDSLIDISKTQKNTEQLRTNLKIAKAFAYGTNGDSTIYYASLCHRQSIALNNSTASLKATLYWGSGLFSKKKYKEAIEKTNEVFRLAKKLNTTEEIVQGLYLKAKCHQRLHEYEHAIAIYQDAYDHSMEILAKKNNIHMAEYCKGILKQMTYCYWYATKISKGIKYFLSIIKENPSVSDNIKRGYFSNIAFLYNRNSNLIEAETYLLKAVKISKTSSNWNDHFQDLSYLGVLYTAKGDLKKAIGNYQKALALARKNNNPQMLSYIISNLGECYELNGDLKTGVSLLYDGISMYQATKDSVGIAMGYQQLGYLMFKWNNYEGAKKYYERSLACNEKLGVEIKIAKLNLDLAISCMFNNERDSSLYYIKATENLLPKCEDQKLIANYNIYKAQSELKFNSAPHEALKYALTAQNIADKNVLKPISNISKLIIGECYIKLDRLQLAKKHVLASWKNFKSMNRLYDKSRAAKSLSVIYKKLQQADSAYYYLNEAEKINSKIRERDQTLALYEKDSKFTVLLAQKEKKLLVKENVRLFNRITLIRLFYVSIFILLTSFIVIYLKQRTKRFNLELHKKELAKKELIEESNQHKSVIKENSELIQAKEEIIEELHTKLQQNKDSDPSKQEFNEIDYLVKSKLSTEENWDEYLSLYSKKYPFFIPKLKSKYHNLSRNEIKIFILTKLNLTTREMAEILMISPSSVNTARYRLRKKINLDSAVKLEDAISELEETSILEK